MRCLVAGVGRQRASHRVLLLLSRAGEGRRRGRWRGGALLDDVLLGLLLVISDDDGDGELICCGCRFNCCFCDVGVEEERRRRNDQRRPNGPNFLCVVSQNYEI